MAKFAQDTTVSPEDTLIEIQRTLRRYKAAKFGCSEDDKRVTVVFELNGWQVRFSIDLPRPEEFKRNSTGAWMSPVQARQSFEKAVRQRYRALLLVIKAKLESVENNIESFEHAFLANVILPDGRTMGEWAVPEIQKAYQGGSMPPMLPSGR
jgi:hypothetical protein